MGQEKGSFNDPKVGSGSGTARSSVSKTQSPRLCQVIVPPDWAMVSPSVILAGGGTTSTPKTPDEIILALNLNPFEAYKNLTHPYLVHTSTESKKERK